MLRNKDFKIFTQKDYFTMFVLFIYIFGSNISIIGNESIKTSHDSFLN